MTKILANGTEVKINQGHNRFTEGVVTSFTSEKNRMGHFGNYAITVTGGFNLFGKPATIGSTRNVHHSNVEKA